MKVGVLTSSRADYGIYKPLLLKLDADDYFNLEIIAFGMHLSQTHGLSVKHIEKDGLKKIHKIETLLDKDDKASISESYGVTVTKFSQFWKNNTYDLVFCLGDRFEMSAAVQATIPFNITLAHIHGGETTLGAIDNIYRHQITLASKIHFTATEVYKQRVIQLVKNDKHVYNIGALSLDTIENFSFVSKEELLNTFQIENKPFVLCTFHPETIAAEDNILFTKEIKKALLEICKTINIVITMPNADTQGSIYRKVLKTLQKETKNSIYLVENFGKTYYFSAMKYCVFMLGNTSSGIIEAASFGKFVVNVGNRQKGRTQSKNILNANFSSEDIICKVKEALLKRDFKGDNVYYKPESSKTIIALLKTLYD